MRNFGVEPFGNAFPYASGMRQLRFIDSRVIWLALDENHEDSRRVRRLDPLTLEPVTGQELDLYHRQLFYWLLIRQGASVFAPETRFEQGFPAGFRVRN